MRRLPFFGIALLSLVVAVSCNSGGGQTSPNPDPDPDPDPSDTNVAPVAQISLISPTSQPERLRFGQLQALVSFEGSTDADGQIKLVDIDWGDGAAHSRRDIATPGDLVIRDSHLYTRAGTFAITATVTDNGTTSKSGTDTVSVEIVGNGSPVACATFNKPELGGVITLQEGAPLVIDPSCSADPDASLFANGFASVNYGDGATFNDQRFPELAIQEHRYASPGTRTLTLVVDDREGQTDSKSWSVNVTPNAAPTGCVSTLPPTVGGRITIAAEEKVIFNFDCSSDPDSDLRSTARLDVTFGDGPVLSNELLSTFLHMEKPYVTPGTYQWQATVRDEAGKASLPLILEIVVTAPVGNQSPVAVIAANPTSGPVPLVVNFDGSSSTDPDGVITSYPWSFADVMVSGGGNSVQINPSHTFTQANNSLVTLTVIDNSGVGPPNDRNVAQVLITATP